MLITQLLATVSGKNATRPAFRYLGKETNYREFQMTVGRLSYLYQHDLASVKSPRIALFARNSPAFVMSFLALTNIRALIIPIDPDLPPDETGKWIKEAAPTHIAVTSDLVKKAKEVLQAEGLSLPLIEIEKKFGGEYDTSYTPPPENQPAENDVILWLRTAGTTGAPKFVAFTHKQLQAAAASVRGTYHLMPTDRFFTALNWSSPFAFVHGMLVPVLSGATCVIHHGIQASELLAFLLDSRVTRIVGTPLFFYKLLVTCKNEKKLLPGVKSVTVGLGFLEPALVKAFGLLRVSVCHCYGQTENLWTISMEEYVDASEAKDAPAYERGSIGKGLPGFRYKVMDENGDEVEGDVRTGHLAIMSPMVMQNYPGREKETKGAIRGTWLYTTDVVTLKGEGEELRLSFAGRKDDMLSVGGATVPFAKIDAAIKTHPSVQDAASFGVKSSKGQFSIACAIVRKAGANVNEKQILEHCQTRLMPQLMPQAIAFTDLIPRDPGNNVNQSKLRSQFSGIVG